MRMVRSPTPRESPPRELHPNPFRARVLPGPVPKDPIERGLPMSSYPHLLSTVRVGALTLPNRVVMAPMTRSRATNPERAPFELHAEYYRQRAGA